MEDQLTSMLAGLLNDEESMKQIGDLFSSFGLGGDPGGGTADGPADGASAGPAPPVDLSALFGMLGNLGGAAPGQSGGGEAAGQNGGTGGAPGMAFDPSILLTLNRAFAAMQAPDKNIDLLRALRPYLNPDRREKVDEVVKILQLLKLLPFLTEGGLLKGFFGGGGS